MSFGMRAALMHAGRRAIAAPPAGVILNPFGVAGAPALGSISYPIPGSNVIYVNGTSGNDGNNGSNSTTLAKRTVESAIDQAGTQTGRSTIVIAAGVYHPDYRSSGRAITMQAAAGAVVWFDGAGVVPGAWTQEGTLYKNTSQTMNARRLDPFSTPPSPYLAPGYPAAGYPEQVFVDGTQITQKTTKTGLGAPAQAGVPDQFFYDFAATPKVLYLNADPAGNTIEFSYLRKCLDMSGAFEMYGIGVKRYASEHDNTTNNRGYAPVQISGLSSIVKNCRFEDNSYAGIITFAQNSLITQSTFARNGKLGIHGNLVNGSEFSWNYLVNNNREHFITWWEAGGMKLSHSVNTKVHHNLADANYGFGIWFDIYSDNAEVNLNRAFGNWESGIFFEISRGGMFVGNLCNANRANGLHIGSSWSAVCWNNTCLNNWGSQLVLENSGRPYYPDGNNEVPPILGKTTGDIDPYLPGQGPGGTATYPNGTEGQKPSVTGYSLTARNNLISTYGASSSDHYGPMISAHDNRSQRIWHAGNGFPQAPNYLSTGMGWDSQSNAFYRASSTATPVFGELANAGSGATDYTSLAALKAPTTPGGVANELNSIQIGTPPMVGALAGDYRPTGTAVWDGTSGGGISLPSNVAALLGVSATAHPCMGAVQV